MARAPEATIAKVAALQREAELMMHIPEQFATTLDRHVIVYVATLNGDGSPQVSPVWIERDGDVVRFGNAEGRSKWRNLRRDNRLALSFTDPDDPNTSFSMRGHAVAIEQRGWSLMDRLAGHYRGSDRFPRIEGMTRVDVDCEIDTASTNRPKSE